MEKVVAAVGLQTKFHDSEILTVELTRVKQEPSLTISILTRRSLWASEKDPSDPMWYIVSIKSVDVDELKLSDFNHQNVIQELIETVVEGRIKIWFASSFGAECSFTCAHAEVVSVEETEMEWATSVFHQTE